MKVISIFSAAGDFAENKDIAKSLRISQLMPAIAAGEDVTLDFTSVSLSTQSFVHALVSDAIRKHGIGVLDQVFFKGCNPAIRALVATVCDYMQDTTHVESREPERDDQKQRKKRK